MKFSDGPWRAADSTATGLMVYGGGVKGRTKHAICNVFGWADPLTGPANLQLIARAPELHGIVDRMQRAWAEGRFEPNAEFREMVSRTLGKIT